MADFSDECAELRKEIKAMAARVRALGLGQFAVKVDPVSSASLTDAGEVRANAMLAYRHLEDATMRVGKMIQAWDGGTSVYDK